MHRSSLLAIAIAAATAACASSRDTPMLPTFDAGPDGAIGIDANPDTGPFCAADESVCSGRCVRLGADDRNCGTCGVTCPPGVGCAGGSCSCLAPMLACDGLCVDPESDATNCGGCGNACEPGMQCTGGACIAMCSAPREICFNPAMSGGGDAGADGGDTVPVCADLMTDPVNCGRCNTRCAPTAVCKLGRCTCAAGLRACRGVCTDVATDPANCGACGNSCGMDGVCTDGECTCGTDRLECAGRCLDVSSDPRNCGGCARACGPGEGCSGGRCVCAGALVDCGMGCRDLTTDVSNCGACGTSCGPGGTCTDGRCACVAGLTLCSGSCRNLTNDAMNCGSCGNACPAGNVCVMGACTDAPPTRYMQTAPTAAEVPFLDACAAPGATMHLAARDDASERVSLPFPFRYWATDLPAGSMINITTNGWIGMDGTTLASLSGTVPSASAPNAVIAPHWGDNYTRGAMCVATFGTAPNRQWVVQWNDTYYCCGGAAGGVHNTYEVILHETSGIIDLVFERMDMARAQTMGIENQTGMMGINACPGGAGTCTPTAGQRVRFLPIP